MRSAAASFCAARASFGKRSTRCSKQRSRPCIWRGRIFRPSAAVCCRRSTDRSRSKIRRSFYKTTSPIPARSASILIWNRTRCLSSRSSGTTPIRSLSTTAPSQTVCGETKKKKVPLCCSSGAIFSSRDSSSFYRARTRPMIFSPVRSTLSAAEARSISVTA